MTFGDYFNIDKYPVSDRLKESHSADIATLGIYGACAVVGTTAIAKCALEGKIEEANGLLLLTFLGIGVSYFKSRKINKY